MFGSWGRAFTQRKMMKKVFHKVIMSVAFLGTESTVQALNGKMLISGVGAESCATYSLALADNRPTSGIKMEGRNYFTEANAYTQWLVGFVSGVSWVDSAAIVSKNTGKRLKLKDMSVDVNGVALWVKNYCDANPAQTIFDGATAYINKHL
jgi:hypothetical protein